jgi:hypothetical protein
VNDRLVFNCIDLSQNVLELKEINIDLQILNSIRWEVLMYELWHRNVIDCKNFRAITVER